MLLTFGREFYFGAIIMGLISLPILGQTTSTPRSPSLYLSGHNTVIGVSESGEITNLPNPFPLSMGGDFEGRLLLVDSQGLLNCEFYLENLTNSPIAKLLPDGSWSNVSSGLVRDMILSPTGGILVSGAGTICKINSKGTATAFATGLPDGSSNMAFDSKGSLFVADFVDSSIYKIPISKNTGLPGKPVLFARLGPPRSPVLDKLPYWLSFVPGVTQNIPTGMVFGPDGNLYIAAQVRGANTEATDTRSKIFMITPSGDISTYADGFDELGKIAFDADGNLLANDYFAGVVYAVTKTNRVEPFVSTSNQAAGLALDPSFRANLNLNSSKSRPTIVGHTQVIELGLYVCLLVMISSAFYRWWRKATKPSLAGN